MLNKLFLGMLVGLTSLTVAPSAHAFDIHGDANTKHYIAVEKSGDLRKFELCKDSKHCQELGPRTWYSIGELETQRNWEIAQASASTAGGVVAALVVYITGGSAIQLASVGATTAAAIYGSAAVATASAAVSNAGPVEQWEQQYVLRSDVVNDGDIVLSGASDKKIIAIARRLESLLAKL